MTVEELVAKINADMEKIAKERDMAVKNAEYEDAVRCRDELEELQRTLYIIKRHQWA